MDGLTPAAAQRRPTRLGLACRPRGACFAPACPTGGCGLFGGPQARTDSPDSSVSKRGRLASGDELVVAGVEELRAPQVRGDPDVCANLGLVIGIGADDQLLAVNL
jgi:hypothetical protein